MTDLSILRGKHIVLGITGGIAAYKSAMLTRLFVKAGAEVQVIMTPNAREFITPVTLSTLSGRPVITEFFSANTGEWHSHVDLGLWADAMIIAPATASTIAKMANGVADNMLVTSYLSTRGKVFVAPAMDLDMMVHPTTKRNIALLQSYGAEIIEATEGELASHLVGKGRMAEPAVIADAIASYFAHGCDLAGKKVLITAGPTYEKIDPVRFIGNYSTGKMGFAIANAAAARGADVVLVAGPVGNLSLDSRVRRIDVESACEMLASAESEFASADYTILSAAVADYRPAEVAEHKIKREKDKIPTLELIKNPDIAATLGTRKHDGQRLIGFALETDNETANAADKIHRKNLDMIVLNSLRDPGAGFGTDTNKITLMYADGRTADTYPLKSKADVADDIIDKMLTL
ncbi:MAG: bifunctional phosphopantothenoylcysteine decarboxylase/phosphopantothenate--cysteine ligase CoaBC [Bacteroidales bacterium]|nr:bifunctional phosphopantothenoylcysteine decarboxylase/phosphopantothenate--cysteine ligase CoaBC [Bacteroidales bacterium]